MSAFIGWCALVALGILALSVGIAQALKPLCLVSYWRFGVPEQPSSSQVGDLEHQRSVVSHDGSTALAGPLDDLETENVITLAPEDWWTVDE